MNQCNEFDFFQGLEVTPANLARALSAVAPALRAAPARPATLSINLPQPCTDPVRGKYAVSRCYVLPRKFSIQYSDAGD